MIEPTDRKSDAYREYVKWMASVWKANDERNRSSMILPNGQSYQEYCSELRSRGRIPLPYDVLMEPIWDEQE